MTRPAWSPLRRVLADLDRQLWQSPNIDPTGLARVIMTFKHTKPLTASDAALPVPPPANDLD